MSPPSPGRTDASFADAARLDELCDRFESAWRSGRPDRIEDFVAAEERPPEDAVLEGADSAGVLDRRRLVQKLVALDLWYRWRERRRANGSSSTSGEAAPTHGDSGGGPAGPHVEEYLARFPELRRNGAPPLECILAECRARAEWDAAPRAEELQARFGLPAKLSQELAEGGSAATPPTGEAERLSPPWSAARLPAPGTVLGNYVLEQMLGQGGMGAVFKARHRRMGRTVALKLISPAALSTPEGQRRFQREVLAAAQLSHPHVVITLDADVAEDWPFLVMEHLAGENLAAHVRRAGPLPPAEAVDCLLQAARGLAYVHARGVLHRDVKPSNLMRGPDGVVKVLDLGLARLDAELASEDTLTRSGEVLGTVDFLAPEQALDSRRADVRADVYALGATLWFLLAGRPLYDAGSAPQRLLAHQTHPPPDLRAACPEAPPRLAALFRRMVAKSPQDRPQSMAEVVAELEACRREEAGAADEAQADGADVTREGSAAAAPACLRRWARGLAAAAAVSLGALAVWAGGRWSGVLDSPAAPAPTGWLQVEVPESVTYVTVPGTPLLFTEVDRVEVPLASGQHMLCVHRGGREFHTQTFPVRPGQVAAVRLVDWDDAMLVTADGDVVGRWLHASPGPPPTPKPTAAPPGTGTVRVLSLGDRNGNVVLVVLDATLAERAALVAAAQRLEPGEGEMHALLRCGVELGDRAKIHPGYDGILTFPAVPAGSHAIFILQTHTAYREHPSPAIQWSHLGSALEPRNGPRAELHAGGVLTFCVTPLGESFQRDGPRDGFAPANPVTVAGETGG